MERSLYRRIVDFPLLPGSFLFNVIFASFRLLSRSGILKSNTDLQFVSRDDWLFVMTPLAGSSSLRVLLSDVKTHDLLKRQRPAGCEKGTVKTCYVLSRDYEARLGSFYNKKVRNPTSIGKSRLLATCKPLTWRTNPQEFVDWAAALVEVTDKDKHLYTLDQIALGFGFGCDDVTEIDISKDAAEIEHLLGIKLGARVNTSESVATFAEPLPLPGMSVK